MIYEVQGDIMLSKAEGIVQGVAPNDEFKHGLAFTLKEKYPSLYKEFRSAMHKKHMPEGSMWAWDNGEGRKVFSLFTQEHAPGHGTTPGKAKTSYVNHSLKELRKFIEKEGLSSLAIPKIATGVGGLEWSEVKPIIDKYLGDLDMPVYIYKTFHKGEAAMEVAAKGVENGH